MLACNITFLIIIIIISSSSSSSSSGEKKKIIVVIIIIIIIILIVPYVAKFSRPKNFANRCQKGGRNIRDKNIREGGSDSLRNTVT